MRTCLAATPEGATVAIVDLLAPAGSPWPFPDATERKHYHGEQIARAEKEKRHFAAAYHLGRLLLDDPDNAGLKLRRGEARRRHDGN